MSMATQKGSGVFFRIGPTAARHIQRGRRPIRKKTPDPLDLATHGEYNTHSVVGLRPEKEKTR